MIPLQNDRKILLQIGDGPEGLTIYTSNGSDHRPALFITVSTWNAAMTSKSHFGPFVLSSTLIAQLKTYLKGAK